MNQPTASMSLAEIQATYLRAVVLGCRERTPAMEEVERRSRIWKHVHEAFHETRSNLRHCPWCQQRAGLTQRNAPTLTGANE